MKALRILLVLCAAVGVCSAQAPNDVFNPLTGKLTLPNFDRVNYKGDWGVGSYHGLLTTIQRTAPDGLLSSTSTWAHAINAYDSAPQNVACRSCEKGRSNYDARHSFCARASYPLPLTVTISCAATALPNGNSAAQSPKLIPGVPLIPPGGQTIGQWINPAPSPCLSTGNGAMRAGTLSENRIATSLRSRPLAASIPSATPPQLERAPRAAFNWPSGTCSSHETI